MYHHQAYISFGIGISITKVLMIHFHEMKRVCNQGQKLTVNEVTGKQNSLNLHSTISSRSQCTQDYICSDVCCITYVVIKTLLASTLHMIKYREAVYTFIFTYFCTPAAFFCYKCDDMTIFPIKSIFYKYICSQ